MTSAAPPCIRSATTTAGLSNRGWNGYETTTSRPNSRHHDVASDGGGENWAIVASLVESCKLSGVDPFVYLADVLAKIVNGHLNHDIDHLLPNTKGHSE